MMFYNKNQSQNEKIGDNDRSTSSDEEREDTRQEVELDLDFDSDTDESSDDDSATPTRSKRPCKGKASATVRAKGNSRSGSSTYRVPQAGDSNVDLDLINNSDRAAAASNEPEWLQIEHDETSNNFRFAPPFTGVCDQVNENFTPFDCLSLLVDNEVKETLIKSINEFAEVKIKKNTPLRRHSKYHKWTPVNNFDLLKFFAVTIMMGIDQRGDISDYFSLSPDLYTPFYHQVTTCKKFSLIYSSMLHAGNAQAQGKEKIEPFINLLLQKFRSAFYLYQRFSLDEMIIGFKVDGHSNSSIVQSPKSTTSKLLGFATLRLGMLEGKRSRGKQREKLIEGLADWLKAGKSLEAIEATKDRKKWRTMIANAVKQGT
ncbi:PiggyBac transposable element-derived protein 4 [Plakobranchus ocellatus]|uniref:PiggyBac transposable element-derived protein 4 n=1 Tax=Plakobranchus ocellatus TaxID=259542 RepID=A0AAV4BXY6_9GAST|nr:PiggyBac transposable element-derived protein 4 [Plakobranchus ocellatus]